LVQTDCECSIDFRSTGKGEASRRRCQLGVANPLQDKTDVLPTGRIDPDTSTELEFVILNLGGRWLNAGLKRYGEIVGVDLVPILTAFWITEPGSPFEHSVG
jgi:hypothetical protein